MTYLITFSWYGTHLHGSELGSVDRWHYGYGCPGLAPVWGWVIEDRRRTTQAPYELDPVHAHAVVDAIRETCSFRGWSLIAVHARTTHVHTVIGAEAEPEIVVNTLKAHASGGLNHRFGEAPETRRWSRHGSTRYWWTRGDVAAAVRYVVEEQGAPLALWAAPDWFTPHPRSQGPGVPGSSASHRSLTGNEKCQQRQPPLPYGRGSDYGRSSSCGRGAGPYFFRLARRRTRLRRMSRSPISESSTIAVCSC